VSAMENQAKVPRQCATTDHPPSLTTQSHLPRIRDADLPTPSEGKKRTRKKNISHSVYVYMYAHTFFILPRNLGHQSSDPAKERRNTVTKHMGNPSSDYTLTLIPNAAKLGRRSFELSTLSPLFFWGKKSGNESLIDCTVDACIHTYFHDVPILIVLRALRAKIGERF